MYLSPLVTDANGKTIIECLRYSATGDLPPNSKGGAFIHDPKISGEREVLAQVKLAFINTNGVQMIITRSMQLVVKKTARTFKTLEGQLLALNNGQRTTMSTRCADLDAQMPLYLGVSKAVLDYVIFCHQEDSLWPLSEPSVVKKRFDEIFEATKFTKALDNIKSLRKEYGVDIKLREKETQYLSVEKERADKAEKRRDELLNEIDTYKEEARVLKQEMEQVTAETRRFFESNQRFQEIIYKLDNCKKSKQLAETSIDRLSSGLEEMSETDAELQQLLDTFTSKTEHRRAEIEQMQTSRDAGRNQLEESRRNHNKAILREGQLRSQADSFKAQVTKLDDYMRHKIKKYSMTGADNKEEFEKELTYLKQKMAADLEKSRMNGSEAENEISKRINDITTNRLRQEQKKLSLRESMKTNDHEIHQLQAAIDAIGTDEGKLAYDKSQLNDLETKLESAKKERDEIEATNETAEKEGELRELERQMDQSNADLAICNQQADERARLSLLKDDLSKRKTGLRALVDANRLRFEAVMKRELDLVSVEADLKEAIRSAQKEVDDQLITVDSARRGLSQTETRLKIAENELTKKTEESTVLKQQIKQILGDEGAILQYDTILADLEADVVIATQNLEQVGFTVKYYETAVEIAQSGAHKCLLCSRQFNGDTELQAFIDSVQQKTAALPTSREEAERSMQETQKDLENVRRIGPDVSRALSIDNREGPQLNQEIEELKEELAKRSRDCEAKLEILEALKLQLADIESLRRISADVARNQREVRTLEGQVVDLKRQMPDTGVNLSVSEIHKILTDLNTKAKELKIVIGHLNSVREKARAEMSLLQNSVSAKKLDISHIESQLADKKNKLEQIESLREKVTSAQAEIKVANDELDLILPDLKEHEQALLEAKRESAANEKRLNDRYSEVYQALKEFQNMNRVINDYITRGGEQRLEQCRKEVERFLQEIKANVSRLEEIETKISAEEKVLLDMRGYERTLKDNLEVRKLNKDLDQLVETIAELESHHAERDKAKYEQETARLRNKYTQLNTEYSSRMGEVKQMDDQLKRLNEELETEFLNIREDYCKSVIKLQTTTVANEDLATYGKALDSAIMKYHSMKMEEINRIIDELWKKTYTGTDVDTILIRSDSENAKGNRAYNYRVCMVKQDVELDMRGRCSAGQKVLASIIIRLALSECFGTNCGLIALDEPTTNLDSENIESLAKSLSSIIEMRRVQKNFQMIVITHDEHFLANMNASAYADHFFRVTRNNRQMSQIQCLPISRIVE
jgi:DNA repair protein RAD50